MPTISDDDMTLIAAAELLKAAKDTFSKSTKMKLKHAKIVNKMTEILKTGRVPRVKGPAPRVGAPTSSEDTTAPRVVKAAPRVHLRRTRRNNPMPTIIEETVENQEVPEFSSEEYYAKPREKRNSAKNRTRSKKSRKEKETINNEGPETESNNVRPIPKHTDPKNNVPDMASENFDVGKEST